MLHRIWMALAGVCLTMLLGAAPAHAQEGTLEVNANVPQAVVHIDGQLAGPAPMTRQMAVGSYLVRVTADGFDPFVRQVRVEAGQSAQVGAQLSRGGGTADFLVEPAGARVEINGKDTGLVTPTRLTGLQDGRYRYRLVRDGYEPIEGDFEVKNRSNPLVFHEMKSSRGLFVITSDPEGATVYLDGKQVGVTPLELEGIEPGMHQVGVQAPGHALLVREVDTSDGSKGEVRARLKKDGGTLTIKTGSPDAVVHMDGVPVGTGKRVKVKATRGTYQVDVDDSAGSAVGSAKVPATGSALYVADLEAGELELGTPLTRRWTFWTGVGVGVAAIGTGSAIAAVAARPDPLPSGDVTLTLP